MRRFFYTAMVIVAAVVLCGCQNDREFAGSLTDPLDSSLWDNALWISAVNAPVFEGVVKDGCRCADGSVWFVSSFTNDSDIASARWMTAGLGVYELYVNGKIIGEEVLKPGFTHYAKTKISYTYDITDVIDCAIDGKNTLAVQMTPGWWADKIITPRGNDGMLGKKCAFRGVLELTFSNGERKVFTTNPEDWKAGVAGPVKHASIFDGEDYDAREPLGFETMDKLSTPEVNTEFTGEIIPTCGAEIYFRKDLALDPVQVYVWSGISGESDSEFGKVNVIRTYTPGETIRLGADETLVVDFGQNCAGVPSFEFKGAEGTVLTCLPSEILNDGNGSKERGMDGPEGSCHRLNLRCPETGMRMTYTFGNKTGYVSYNPRYTFFGYRYVSITTTDEICIKKIISLPVTSISKDMETGFITTGDELINKLISNTVWGQRSNYLSVTTDCPQRNERLGWTADTQVFAETGSFFANTDAFFHKWTRDLRDTQSPLGAFPGVAPFGQYGASPTEMMRIGWADAGVIVPWTVWKQFGDNSIVEENWDAMEFFMKHVADTKYDHKVLIEENGSYQWADWLSYEPMESSCSKRLDDYAATVRYWNYLGASYWLIDAGMMKDMALAIGKDASVYEKMIEDARQYIKTEFLYENGEFKNPIMNTMQTPALFALKNGLVEGAVKDAMIARLRDNFAAHDNCLQTGFLGTSILMQTLTENGMVDIAYELLFQRRNPSWLYSVDNGATTIWERWNSYTIESGMGPKGMNSFNHYAYGCVCEWLWETAAGISADVADPGFHHIIMKPIPDRRLGSLTAKYKSASGLICSEWKYEGDNFVWSFTIPEGCYATVTLPGETSSMDYSPGTYQITCCLPAKS